VRIRVGLIGDSLCWSQLLRQEGVPFATASVSNLDTSSWSAIVVARPVAKAEADGIKNYLRDGGSLLAFAGHVGEACGLECVKGRIDYLVSDGDDPFNDVRLLDLGMDGIVPREANILRTDAGVRAMLVGPLQGGHAVILPFDPAAATTDWRSANKSFFFTRERLPSERVSMVSKGEIRYLIHRSLEYLHHARGLPFVHLWYYPGGKQSLFAFRVDTDSAPKDEIDDLYHISSDHRVPFTWYLDVKSHEDWLSHFGTFASQEIGVHCYVHKTFDGYEQNLKNITDAVRAMNETGLKPRGFSAPYGIWNPELARAVDDLGFLYTSEFSYLYDSLPIYPMTGECCWKALQVPIHPICIGSMLRVGYKEKQMMDYFEQVVAWKVSRGEPLFFYHHPLHRCWAVVEGLLGLMNKMEIASTTLGDYARWWKNRETCVLKAEFGGDVIGIDLERGDVGTYHDLWIEVTTPDGRSQRLPVDGGKVDLRKNEGWETIQRAPAPADIRRIREFDPRAALGQLYTLLQRKLR